MNILNTMGLMAVCVGLSACATLDEVPHDGDHANMQPRTLDLTDFHRVNIDTDGEIHIRRGDAYKVILYTEAHHFPAIEASVKDGTLHVDHVGRKHSKSHVKLDITSPQLDDIGIDGVVEAKIKNLNTESLELRLSSVGDIDVDGVCEQLILRVSGIGDFDASKLDCQHVSARVSGIGDTKIMATKTIDIKASGIGDVSVYGAPQVKNMKASGLGDMNFRN